MSSWESSFQPASSPAYMASFQPDSYTQSIANDMGAATRKIGDIWANQDLNPASRGVQILATAGNAAFAPVNEAISRGYNSLPDKVTKPISNAISSGVGAISGAYHKGVDSLADTSQGKAIGDYLMDSPHAQKIMQEVSDDGKSLANVLTLGKIKPKIGELSEAAGNILYDSGKAVQDLAHQKYIQDLVLPKETPTVKADKALNTKQEDGKNIYQPSPAEVEMAKTVGEIPGIGKSLSPQGNLSKIVEANRNEANSLQETLQRNNVSVDLGIIQNGINQSMKNLADHPYVTGDGVPASLNVVKIMNKAILDNAEQNGTITTANLLKARKDFDKALPPRVFTSTTDTPVMVAAKEMRKTINEAIASADPSANVLESLKKQSVLYDAADNIAPKAAGEAITPFKRAMQAVSPHNLTEALGISGLGAGALAASHYVNIPPAALGMALTGAGIYKGIKAPTTRILLGKALGGGQ